MGTEKRLDAGAQLGVPATNASEVGGAFGGRDLLQRGVENLNFPICLAAHGRSDSLSCSYHANEIEARKVSKIAPRETCPLLWNRPACSPRNPIFVEPVGEISKMELS
jgi:hypothetical protein